MKPHRTIVRPQPWTNVSIARRLYMTVGARPAATPDGMRSGQAVFHPAGTPPAAQRPEGQGRPTHPGGDASRWRRIPAATPRLRSPGRAQGRPGRSVGSAPGPGVSSRPRRLAEATPPGGDALSPSVGGLSPRALRLSRFAPHGPQTHAWHAGCFDRRYTTRTRVMSNQLTPTELETVTDLESVTAAAAL